MSIRWPELEELTPDEITTLLEAVPPDDVARACGVDRNIVEGWTRKGVPAGPVAALLRHVAQLNNLSLNPHDARCLLCSARATVGFASTPVCENCANAPLARAEKLGYDVKKENYGHPDMPQQWLGVGARLSFEFPVCALMKRQKSGLFGRSKDPEIGHQDFDDAIHIETEDYEGLFDLFQHPRRRALAKLIASAVTLEINVNQVVVIIPHGMYPPGSEDYRRRLELGVVLLVWSLVNERSEFR